MTPVTLSLSKGRRQSGHQILRTLAATLAFITVAAQALASTTGTIEGRVVAPDGAPLAAAKIELRSEDAGVERTTSDAHGYFHFLSLYPTKYWLLISHSGYFMYWTHDFEIHADQITICNARMARSFTGLYTLPRHGNNVVTCSY